MVTSMMVRIVIGEEIDIRRAYFAGTREEAREGLKQIFNSEYVWFEDEDGTEADPVRGPNPKIGPGTYLNN